MPTFTIAEATDPDVQSDVLGRWLESRGVSRDALSRWPPQPGDPSADLANALVSRIGAVQGKVAQHWGTRAAPEIESGDATPDDIRRAIEKFLTVNAGVIETHIVELWDRPDSEIVTELLSWYDRSAPLAEKRRVSELVKAPSSMSTLPSRERVIRLKYTGGVPRQSWLKEAGERPQTAARFLRPDDPRFWAWLRDQSAALKREAAREAARSLQHKSDVRRRRAPVEVRTMPKTGTVSAGPRRHFRKRKRKK